MDQQMIESKASLSKVECTQGIKNYSIFHDYGKSHPDFNTCISRNMIQLTGI